MITHPENKTVQELFPTSHAPGTRGATPVLVATAVETEDVKWYATGKEAQALFDFNILSSELNAMECECALGGIAVPIRNNLAIRILWVTS